MLHSWLVKYVVYLILNYNLWLKGKSFYKQPFFSIAPEYVNIKASVDGLVENLVA